MYKKYQMAEAVESGKHPVMLQIEKVEAAFKSVGLDVNLLEYVSPRPGSDVSDGNYLITPDMSEALERTLDNIGWLSVNAQIAETFEDVSGSTEITNIVVRENLSVGDVVELLAEADYSQEDDTSMLMKVVHTVEMVSMPKDPDDARKVVAYDVLRKSLGWEAERFLSNTSDFHKMLASRDGQGFDLGTSQDTDWYEYLAGHDGFQLKTVTRVTSQSLATTETEVPHLSYAWTDDGIMVSTMDEHSKPREGYERNKDMVAARLADMSGATGTVMKKSDDGGTMKNYGRAARIIAWE
jgi:hypothetical protein